MRDMSHPVAGDVIRGNNLREVAAGIMYCLNLEKIPYTIWRTESKFYKVSQPFLISEWVVGIVQKN